MSSLSRRPGRVVSIRVNPADCISVVDYLKATDSYRPGMSFSQAVSLVLAGSLESFRKAGMLRTSEGYDYYECMNMFPAESSGRKKALQVTQNIGMHVPGRVAPFMLEETPERKRRRSKLRELRVKVLHASESMSPEEQLEYANLADEFYEEIKAGTIE